MYWLTNQQKTEIKALAAKDAERESCGFVLHDDNVILAPNTADDPVNEFAISPKFYAQYDEQIKGVWHSHLDLAGFSPLDQKVLAADILPWAVYCLRDDSWHECNPTETAPFQGRPFVYGVYDCYALVSDVLADLGVEMPPWKRCHWGEWNTPGFSSFDDQWAYHGKPVTDGHYQRGDILLLNLGTYQGHTDHVGIFVDRKRFLHHSSDSVSRLQNFGGYWSRRLNWVIRPHKLWSSSKQFSC